MCKDCQNSSVNAEYESILHGENEYNFRSAELNPEYNFRSAELSGEYELVGKEDTRAKISDTTAAPFRYICQIRTQTSDGKQWVGSGFFIGPKTILTAGHVIWDESANRKVPNSKILISPARNGSSRPFGTVSPVNVILSYPGFSNSDLANVKDYAIIHLDTALGNTTGYFSSGKWVKDMYGSSILSGGKLPFPADQLKVNVCGYPGDKGGDLQYTSYNQGFAIQEGGKILSYIVDTKGGQSGGPVWLKRDPSLGGRIIVGIHIARGPWDPALASRVLYNRAIFITTEVKNFIDANRR
jgi:V8-like Glu-specific endopeptidase